MSAKRTSASWQARAVVLEVHPLERFGSDLPELLLGGAGFSGVEEAGGTVGPRGDGRVPDLSWPVDPIGAV